MPLNPFFLWHRNPELDQIIRIIQTVKLFLIMGLITLPLNHHRKLFNDLRLDLYSSVIHDWNQSPQVHIISTLKTSDFKSLTLKRSLILFYILYWILWTLGGSLVDNLPYCDWSFDPSPVFLFEYNINSLTPVEGFNAI